MEGGRVVVRYETNTARIMIQDEADGVHKRRGLKLSAEEKWRNGTRMRKKDLVLLLVEAVTGKKLKRRSLHGNADGHQTMKETTFVWVTIVQGTIWKLNECRRTGCYGLLSLHFYFWHETDIKM